MVNSQLLQKWKRNFSLLWFLPSVNVKATLDLPKGLFTRYNCDDGIPITTNGPYGIYCCCRSSIMLTLALNPIQPIHCAKKIAVAIPSCEQHLMHICFWCRFHSRNFWVYKHSWNDSIDACSCWKKCWLHELFCFRVRFRRCEYAFSVNDALRVRAPGTSRREAESITSPCFVR